MRPTPVSSRARHEFDRMPPTEAAKRAWNDPGKHPEYHERMKAEVRAKMPLLARALDRMR